MSDGPFWIKLNAPGRLGTMPRPRGGGWLARDLSRLRDQGVTTLVSMLEQSEEAELELTQEAHACKELDIEFHCLPVIDRAVPSDESEFWDTAGRLLTTLNAGGAIAIHCRAGIGRSSLLAAAIIILLGYSADSAWTLISDARGIQIPDTGEQRSWFEEAVVRRKSI